MRSLRDIQNAPWVGLPLYRGPFGKPRMGSIVGAFEGMNSISEYLFESGGYSGFISA